MGNLIDLSGRRFGRWVATRRAGNNKNGSATWHCRCDCGAERIVNGESLRSGDSQSCGCLHRELTSKRTLVDLAAGQQFGRWTVIRRTENNEWGRATWLCRCDCGNERVVPSTSLRNGDSKSCGCLKRELASKRGIVNEAGNRYGRWTVIRQAKNGNRRQARWLCQCDCGTMRTVAGSTLRNGSSQSCGCLQRERTSHSRSLPKGEASFNEVLGRMKRSAKDRGYEWDLTREQVACLTKQCCYYCGAEPKQCRKAPRHNGPYIYNGLDRLDNDKGYAPGNVVPCCGACNRMKLAMTLEEFTSRICQVYKHFALHQPRAENSQPPAPHGPLWCSNPSSSRRADALTNEKAAFHVESQQNESEVIDDKTCTM